MSGFNNYLPYLQENEVEVKLHKAGYKTRVDDEILYCTIREVVSNHLLVNVSKAGSGQQKLTTL